VTICTPEVLAKFQNEKDVKRLIKKLLDKHQWFWWCPPANGYGPIGVHDFNSLRHGIFLSIEAKFGRNKPTPAQKAFAQTITSHQGFAFAVNERNLDQLEAWLAAFDNACEHQARRLDVRPEDGATMLNAIHAMTEMWR